MINLRQVMMLSVAALAIAGCGEREQTAGQGGARKSDAKAWQGAQAGPGAYAAAGWKAGDKDSWEAQLKTRAQQGQNEYTRAPATTGAAKP